MSAKVLAIVSLVLTSTVLAYQACEIPSYKIGCYDDLPKPRTFPNLLLNARYPGAKNSPGYSVAWDIKKYQEFLPRFICDCAKAVSLSGAKYFGIQYYAECWSGDAEPEDFVKFGLTNSCVNSTFGPCGDDSQQCTGKEFTNMIYYIPDKTETTTRKVTVVTTTKHETTTSRPWTDKIPKTTTSSKTTTKTLTTKKPRTTTTKPPTTTAKLLTTAAKPTTTTTKPRITPAKPSTTKAKPRTTSKPNTTTAKPPTTTAKPATTTMKPETTTATKPWTTAETKPRTTKAKPRMTTTKPNTTTAKPPTTTKTPTSTVITTEGIKKSGCMKKADILIALDISSSIPLDEFEKRKQFMSKFVARFPVNENDVHFALLYYNHNIHTDFTFGDPNYYNISAVQKSIVHVPLLGGATLTQKALDEALQVFSMPQYGARSTSKKILIIVTDGYTYGGEETLELPSLKLQLFGVNIVAAGFGERTNMIGLRMMSNNVLTMDDMLQKTGEELSQDLDMLVRAVCESPPQTI